MKTDKPTPPEGYEVMLGKDVPRPVPMPGGILALRPEKWEVATHCIHMEWWYAVPVQKPFPAIINCPLCGKPECKCWGVPTLLDDTNSAVVASFGQSALDSQIGGNHYKDMAIQPIEFCTKNRLGFAEGLAIKYICRHEQKNGAQDLDKAIHCLQLLRELRYGKSS